MSVIPVPSKSTKCVDGSGICSNTTLRLVSKRLHSLSGGKNVINEYNLFIEDNINSEDNIKKISGGYVVNADKNNRYKVSDKISDNNNSISKSKRRIKLSDKEIYEGKTNKNISENITGGDPFGGKITVQYEPVKEESPEDVQLLDHLTKEFKCPHKDERCVLDKAHKQGLITSKEFKESKLDFKPEGPTDTTWFNNENIFSVLVRWSKLYKDFYPVPYAMRDFMKYKDEYMLATLSPSKLMKQGYKTFGCVCNTDFHVGGGIHWVAIFGDMRDPKLWTIEFFNSSGTEYKEFMDFTIRAVQDLKSHMDPGQLTDVQSVNSSYKSHQKSNSECGAYSLYYIWIRLQGKPYTFFRDNFVSDSNMLEFRSTIFANN
jgi:hypothetical protein